MQPTVSRHEPESAGLTRMIGGAAVALALLLIGGTLMLWHAYGTTVFFEMVRSGIAACF